MADFELDITDVTRGGVTAAYNTVDGTVVAAATLATDDRFIIQNNGRVMLHFVNLATAASIEIDTPGTVDGLPIGNRTIPIAINTAVFVGPFPTPIYNNSAAQVVITLTTPTTLTAAPLRI